MASCTASSTKRSAEDLVVCFIAGGVVAAVVGGLILGAAVDPITGDLNGAARFFGLLIAGAGSMLTGIGTIGGGVYLGTRMFHEKHPDVTP